MAKGHAWLTPVPDARRYDRCQHCGVGVPVADLVGDACPVCRERGHSGSWRACETCRIEAFTLRERIEDALSWAEGCRP